VLAGAVAGQRPDQGDLVDAAGPLHVDQGGAAAVGQVIAGEQAPALRRRQAGIALLVAPARAAGRVPVVILGHDLPQGLHLRPAQQAGVAVGQVLQQPPGVRPGVVQALAQADWPAVAAAPVVIDQAVQDMAGGAGELLQCRADRLGDQLQAGQVAHRRQDVGGVSALGGALADNDSQTPSFPTESS
jgi:hypothetical protein